MRYCTGREQGQGKHPAPRCAPVVTASVKGQQSDKTRRQWGTRWLSPRTGKAQGLRRRRRVKARRGGAGPGPGRTRRRARGPTSPGIGWARRRPRPGLGPTQRGWARRASSQDRGSWAGRRVSGSCQGAGGRARAARLQVSARRPARGRAWGASQRAAERVRGWARRNAQVPKWHSPR